MKERLAIVGTGMAGMSSAYFLQDKYDITIFEKNNYVGGHTNTISVETEKEKATFDTGFMVFNEETYPNMLKLFKKLGVKYKNTDMSFAVSHQSKNIEFSGTGLNGLFGQRKNLLRPRYYKTLFEINRFNQEAVELIEKEDNPHITLGEFLSKHQFSNEMKDLYLVPMSSAVWSTPHEQMSQFPAKMLIQFFKNHGFLGLNTQFQWKTVEGGSKNYRDLLIKRFEDKIHTSTPVEMVSVNEENKAVIHVKGEEQVFDKALLASHADESLSLRKNPTELEQNLLKEFKYQENMATVHTDTSVMPKTKNVWSSWNYLLRKNKQDELKTFTVYWMNNLQGVSDQQNYFVNINGEEFVDQKKILRSINYHHPIFNSETDKVQPDLHLLNKHDHPVYYCGSYFRYGFHEDALLSGIEVSKSLLNQEEVL